VIPNGGLVREVNIENEIYLSTLANPNTSQKYQCDTFSGKYIQVGYYFTNWGPNVYNNKGCDDLTVSQNYYLSVGNCCTNYAGNNIFPYESRTFALLENITFFTPEGYVPLHFSLRNVRTSGTGLVKVERVDTIRPNNPGSDTLNFSTIKHYSKEFELPDDGFYGIFTAKLRPTCKTPLSASIPVNYQFDFREQSYLGNSLQSYHSNTRGDVINYQKPLLKLATQQTDEIAAADTVKWTINLTNASPTSRAENVWIGASFDPQIKLVKLIDTKTGKVIYPVNDIFKLGGFPPAVVNTFEIYATFTLCQPDSIRVFTGSDCFQYPDSLNGYECSADDLNLRFVTSTTTLESSLSGPTAAVDLCEPQRYTTTINNIGKADVYDLKLKVYSRYGMTIKDSVWLFIPGRTDSILLAKPVDLGANIWEIDLTSNDSPLDTNSFKGARQSANTVQLKFYVDTDCEFISSSIFFIQPVGVLKCGDPVEGIYSVSQPLNIKGIKKSYFSNVSLSIDEIDFCENTHFATAKFINLGPDTTKIIDGFELDLPFGISVDTNYISSVINGPKQKPTVISRSSRNSAQWILPSGLQPGDSSVFNLKLTVDHNALECDFNQIYFYAVIQDSAFCVKTKQYCNIKAATSSGFIADSIKKAEFIFTFDGMTSVIENGLEKVDLKYGIRNINPKANSGNIHYVSVYADVNRNMVKDSGDVFVMGDTLLQSLSDTNTQRSLQFNVNSENACNLLLVVDSGMCQCELTTIALPPTQLQNAGMDLTICSDLDTLIGTEGVAGLKYNWESFGNMNRTDTSRIRFNWYNTNKQDTTFQLVLSTIKQYCRSTDTVAVTLHPQMTGAMSYDEKMCKNGIINLGSVITGGKGAKTHQWTPIEGLARTKFAFTQAFPDTTSVYYRTTWDQNGCEFFDSTRVDIKELPIAKIESSPACFGDSIRFSDSTQYFSPFRSMVWDLGNNAITSDSLPVVLYDTSGEFYIQLIVEDIYDCRDTAFDTLEMFPFPTILYDTLLDVCKDDSVTLINKGIIDYGSFTSVWDLGYDTLYGDTVGTRIDAVGTSYIHLKMISDQGCVDEIRDTVSVYTIPSAALSLANHCLGDSIEISAVSNLTSPDTITSYQWNIDGMGLTDTAFKYQFSDTGWHHIDITLRSNQNCFNTQIDSLFVYNNPKASFSLQSILCEEDTVKVLDFSLNDHGTIVSKNWVENNTIEHSADSLSLWIPANGGITLQLNLANEFGCVDTIEETFNSVEKEVPNLLVNGNCEDHLFSFEFTPKRPDSLLVYQLEVSPEFNTNQTNFNHIFAASGDYTLRQKTITTSGCETDTTFIITVNPRPEADFILEYPCEDVRTRFISLSTTSLGQITDYNWDVSSIVFPTDSVAQLNYLDTGSYPIRLEVTNNFGCTDTAFGEANPPTKAILGLQFDPICQFDEQFFEDVTTGLNIPVTTRLFDMGNTDTVKQSIVFPYSYQGYGTFDITLTLITRPNCIYTYTSPIQVDPKPIPGFIVTPTEVNILNPIITVVDQSVNAPLYQYFISDGSNYLNGNFIHEFIDSGYYEITQIVSNPLGCADTLTKSVFVEFATTQFMPSAFTPNGDGYNDRFEPKGLGIDRYELQVFNRWGAKVFETSSNQTYWKGTNQDPGTYMYVVKIIMLDGRYTYRKGMVTLIR
jgi:gliding motility-associated-like protein